MFWFGHLDILTTNQYDIIKSDIDLSQRMISDLAYFARYSEMPWSPYQRDTQSTLYTNKTGTLIFSIHERTSFNYSIMNIL